MSSVLLDTHVFLWILSGSKRLKELKGLKDFPFWTLSPVSLLELKFLEESDRLSLDVPAILLQLQRDERFKIDAPSLEEVFLKAFDFSWTRDPFDRLLVAHSEHRSLPFATCDGLIREHYAHCL